jgi:hypothetical protein
MTLKQGARHIYQKRRIYIDEDTWAAVAAEFYDAQGKMYKVDFLYVTQNYDFNNISPNTIPYSHYNLSNGVHCFQFWLADDRVRNGTLGFCKENTKAPSVYWAPETLASGGRVQPPPPRVVGGRYRPIYQPDAALFCGVADR